jgi:hypothetical protein
MKAQAIKTCGTCEHGVYLDREHVECYGGPPTPILVAAGKDPLGRPVMQCELIRPRIAAKARGCSLHVQSENAAPTVQPPAIDAPRPVLAGLDLSRFKPNGEA